MEEMIRVNGVEINNRSTTEIGIDDLLCGEVNSASMSFMKTPLHVYGKNIDEILEIAKLIKAQDGSYDTVDIFSEDWGDDRDYITTKYI